MTITGKFFVRIWLTTIVCVCKYLTSADSDRAMTCFTFYPTFCTTWLFSAGTTSFQFLHVSWMVEGFKCWVPDIRGKWNSSTTQKLISSLLWKFRLNSAEFKMFCTLAPACQDSDYVNLSYQTFKVVKLSSKLMSNVREISMFSFKFMFLYFVQNHQSTFKTDYPALVLFL